MSEFLDLYPWALPFAIFLGRMCDVPLATIRIMFIARGDRKLAPIIGFVEVFIWIVIISQVLSRADNMVSYVSFAGGFAAGTYLGVVIEDCLALGFYKYRIYVKHDVAELLAAFRKHKFGATLFHAEGSQQPIEVVETIISRKNKDAIEKIIRDFDNEAFVVVEAIKEKSFGIFSVRKKRNHVEEILA